MHLKSLILISVLVLTNKLVNAACNNAWGQCGG